MRVYIIIRILDESGADAFEYKNSYEKKRDVMHKYLFSKRELILNASEIERNDILEITLEKDGQSIILQDAIQYFIIGEDHKVMFPVTISNSIKKTVHVQRMTKRNMINFYITLKDVPRNEYEIINKFSIIDKLDL